MLQVSEILPLGDKRIIICADPDFALPFLIGFEIVQDVA